MHGGSLRINRKEKSFTVQEYFNRGQFSLEAVAFALSGSGKVDVDTVDTPGKIMMAICGFL